VEVDCILIGDCDAKALSGQNETSALAYFLTLADDYELTLRIYRTFAGLRVICVSDHFRPSAPVSQRVLGDFRSDYRYNEMVERIGEFGARLGGKPERMGLSMPKKFDYYALLPKERREWDASYDAVAANYRACEFILQTSECEMPSEIANFIALHDERTKCFSDLPLA
jgi:hypothetical protein